MESMELDIEEVIEHILVYNRMRRLWKMPCLDLYAK